MSTPLQPASLAHSPADSAPAVLVVDDEPAMVAYLSELARRMGRRAVGVGGIKSALDVLRREANVGLMVVDHDLGPGERGIDLLRELSSDPVLSGIPVIVLTGRATPSIAEEYAQYQVAHFLAKPARAAELTAAMKEAMGADAASEGLTRRAERSGGD